MYQDYSHIYLTLPGDPDIKPVDYRPDPLQDALADLKVYPLHEIYPDHFQAGTTKLRYMPAFRKWRQHYRWGYASPEIQVYLHKAPEPLFSNQQPETGAIGIVGQDPLLALVCLTCQQAINCKGLCCDTLNQTGQTRKAVIAPARNYGTFFNQPAGDPGTLARDYDIQVMETAPSAAELELTDYLVRSGQVSQTKVLNLSRSGGFRPELAAVGV